MEAQPSYPGQAGYVKRTWNTGAARATSTKLWLCRPRPGARWPAPAATALHGRQPRHRPHPRQARRLRGATSRLPRWPAAGPSCPRCPATRCPRGVAGRDRPGLRAARRRRAQRAVARLLLRGAGKPQVLLLLLLHVAAKQRVPRLLGSRRHAVPLLALRPRSARVRALVIDAAAACGSMQYLAHACGGPRSAHPAVPVKPLPCRSPRSALMRGGEGVRSTLLLRGAGPAPAPPPPPPPAC
jgi:hypothetical protein